MTKRLAVQNKLIEYLKAIAKDDGYNNDVTTVTKMFPEGAANGTLPVIGVLRGPVVMEWHDETGSGFDGKNLLKHNATFIVIGIASGTDDGTGESLNDALEGLEEDIIECVLKNMDDLDETTEARTVTVTGLEPEIIDPKLSGACSVLVVVEYLTQDNDV